MKGGGPMNHLGTRILETGRLTLRPFALTDAPAMFANWASDPEVTRYLTWPTHETADVSRAVLADWVARYADPAWYQWAIVPKALGEPVGGIAVVKHSDDLALFHIGYCIGRRWWRQGITSEALAVLIRFFFEEVGANRIEACYAPENPNSGRVMARCGMLPEGTHRQAGRNNQGLCDLALCAILREDYFAARG